MRSKLTDKAPRSFSSLVTAFLLILILYSEKSVTFLRITPLSSMLNAQRSKDENILPPIQELIEVHIIAPI